MKKVILQLCITGMLFATCLLHAQNLPYIRPNSKVGLNVFEPAKTDTSYFTGLRIRVGGDLSTIFQGIDQSDAGDTLAELGTNFNLPNANLNLDVQLFDGVTVQLKTFLSSKHHEEAWVKGGHIQFDRLDFIRPGFLDGFMDIATISFGLDEFNYGDAHFRRSDNARVIFNPFMENYILDAFSTEVFGELSLRNNGLIGIIGLTNGKIDQSVVIDSTTDNKPSFYGKIGYDTEDKSDLRFRITGSWYINQGLSNGNDLYGGDRSGARYHHIMETISGDQTFFKEGDFEPRFNPFFKQLTALQFNPFLAYHGLELFGVLELASNSDEEGGGSFTQLAVDALYRFGEMDQFYIGARYNTISGNMVESAPDQDINRFVIGGGWWLTDNVIAKLEYVSQNYEGDGWVGTKYEDGEFSGINLEAGISF